jgi:hypothetical protein
MSHRPSRTACAVALCLALGLAGCSGSGDVDAAGPSTSAAASSSSASGSATGSSSAGGSSGAVDPRAVDACDLLGDDAVTAALGAPVDDAIPNQQTYEVGCSWSTGDGPSITLTLETERPGQETYDSMMQFIESAGETESLDVGEVAQINTVDEGGQVTFTIDAVVNGWYVMIRGYDTDRDATVDALRALESSLVAYTPPAGGSDDGTSPGGSASEGVAGTLKRFEVTIDAPADLAGTTNTENLGQVGLMGFAACSKAPAPIFVVQFNAVPTEEPPTPVGVFGIAVEDQVDPGDTTAAKITIGEGMSDLATPTTVDGTITVDDDGTGGTFEAGEVEGSWECEFVE